MRKYSGLGNTFLILFKEELNTDLNSFIKENVLDLDGVILVGKDDEYFLMEYYNRDGSPAEYCGNGARCFIRFLFDNEKINIGEAINFKVLNRIFEGQMNSMSEVRVEIPEIEDKGPRVVDDFSGSFVIAGVPHFVIELSDTKSVEDFPVNEIGSMISKNNSFEAGSNVNFFSIVNKNFIRVRTYERGVENETMACGTGSASCAYIYSKKNNFNSQIVHVQTNGGVLKVEFKNNKTYLIGGVSYV
jgi:diaminopimelate epimerase